MLEVRSANPVLSIPVLLIVDDEAGILSALCRSLRREGYRILTADSPARAIAVLEEMRVDLVLTDQKMPGMTGLELLAEAKRLCPSAARLLISGWAEAVSPHELEALAIESLLPKPWDDAELKEALRKSLASRASV